MRAPFSLSELCEALGVSRSGYHAARSRQPAKRHTDNQQLLDQMTSIHSHRHPRSYGSPRRTHELHALGLECSPNRVARLMRHAGLRARPRRPFRPKTTRPDHAAHPSPNLLADAFAESAFASLKSEILDDGRPFDSKQSATTALLDYLETFYNRRRRHSSLDCQSPLAFLYHYFQNQKPPLN